MIGKKNSERRKKKKIRKIKTEAEVW